jgi:predicted secreted protein
MNTFWRTAVLAFVFSAIFAAPAPAATSAPPSEPQLVRLSYVQGDVRFNRGDGKQPDLKKPWEQAQVNLPIEQNYALATGDGRAEVEFESGSVIYLAENSVVIFKALLSKNGAPATWIELVSGSLTTGVQTLPSEVFIVDLHMGQFRIAFPESAFVRLDSFLDGMAFTPQSDTGFNFGQGGSSKLHVLKGQTLTYEDGKPPRVAEAGQSTATVPTDWDEWVSASYQARSTAMQAALKASGLTSPIPGLTDMYASGTFSPCAPYGMCWDPSPQAVAALQAPSSQANTQASGTAAGTPFTPRPVTISTLVSVCPFPSWASWTVMANTPEDLSRLTEEAYERELGQNWSWPVCHFSSWIFRKGRYRVVVRKRRRHYPVHWIKDGKKVGFVPAHPADQKGKPPVNLKHGIFTVTSGGSGEHIEKVAFDSKENIENLASPPKAFRPGQHLELSKVDPPKIESHLVAEVARDPKSAEAKRDDAKITYDYGKEAFVRSGVEIGGRASKPVVIGSLSSHGGFGESGARGNFGRPGEGGGSRGGGTSTGAGSESSGSRSSASNSGGGSRSGGESNSGGGSRGGSSGGNSGGGGSSGGTSSGGGSRPR